jgi:hypothetical protein
MTADKLIGDNGVTGRKAIYQSYPTFAAGTTYTYSVYIKSAGFTNAMIWFDSANAAQGAFFGAGSLINLTTGAAPGGQTVVTNVGNDWYRCSITFTPTVGGGYNLQLSLGDANGSGTAVGNGVDGVFVWGAQLELNSPASTYISVNSTPSTTIWYDVNKQNNGELVGGAIYSATSATAAGVLLNGTTQYVQVGSNTQSLLNPTAYTKMIWVRFTNLTNNNNLISSFRNNHNMYMGGGARVILGHQPAGVGVIIATTSVDTVRWWHLTGTFSTTNGFRIYVNGALDAVNTSIVTPVSGTTDIAIGTFGGGNNLFGTVGMATVWNRELTAAEISQSFDGHRSRFGI